MLATCSADSLAELSVELDTASRSGVHALSEAFPASTVVALLDRLKRLLEQQPTLVQVGHTSA